jgi:cell division protein FtsL
MENNRKTTKLPDQMKDVIPYQRYRIEKAENNPDSALFYLEQYQAALDSAWKEQNRIHVYEVEKRYDISQVVYERDRLQIRLLRIVIMGLVLSAVIVSVFFRYRHRINRQLHDRQYTIVEMENEYRVLFARLKEKERVLGEYEKRPEEYAQQKQVLENLRIPCTKASWS